MVNAVRNGKNVRVSESVFDKVYAKKGFRKVEVNPKKTYQKSELEKVAMEGSNMDDIDNIPVSDMSKEQLQRYAKKYNIDTSGASNVSEARKIVKNALRKRNM